MLAPNRANPPCSHAQDGSSTTSWRDPERGREEENAVAVAAGGYESIDLDPAAREQQQQWFRTMEPELDQTEQTSCERLLSWWKKRHHRLKNFYKPNDNDADTQATENRHSELFISWLFNLWGLASSIAMYDRITATVFLFTVLFIARAAYYAYAIVDEMRHGRNLELSEVLTHLIITLTVAPILAHAFGIGIPALFTELALLQALHNIAVIFILAHDFAKIISPTIHMVLMSITAIHYGRNKRQRFYEKVTGKEQVPFGLIDELGKHQHQVTIATSTSTESGDKAIRATRHMKVRMILYNLWYRRHRLKQKLLGSVLDAQRIKVFTDLIAQIHKHGRMEDIWERYLIIARQLRSRLMILLSAKAKVEQAYQTLQGKDARNQVTAPETYNTFKQTVEKYSYLVVPDSKQPTSAQVEACTTTYTEIVGLLNEKIDSTDHQLRHIRYMCSSEISINQAAATEGKTEPYYPPPIKLGFIPTASYQAQYPDQKGNFKCLQPVVLKVI